MSALSLAAREGREQLGLKGPRAAEWLAGNGIALPMTPNTWKAAEEPSGEEPLLVARLGAAEFFLEGDEAGTTLQRLAPSLDEPPPGVYPVIREDWSFVLGGEGVHDVLAQVCNVNFAALSLDSRPVIMTLMIGVAVLVVPQRMDGRVAAAARHDAAGRQYRIWCDPTFGPYLGASLGGVVVECGGRYTGVLDI
jgi:sarcosine oxidase subunit gamma